jgi:hypothetical protein
MRGFLCWLFGHTFTLEQRTVYDGQYARPEICPRCNTKKWFY